MLSDHFSVPFEPEDRFNALFHVAIDATGNLTGGGRLATGTWHHLLLAWDLDRRRCELFVDGGAVTTLPMLRDSEGANYLRLKSAAVETESDGFLVERVEVEISPRPGCR